MAWSCRCRHYVFYPTGLPSDSAAYSVMWRTACWSHGGGIRGWNVHKQFKITELKHKFPGQWLKGTVQPKIKTIFFLPNYTLDWYLAAGTLYSWIRVCSCQLRTYEVSVSQTTDFNVLVLLLSCAPGPPASLSILVRTSLCRSLVGVVHTALRDFKFLGNVTEKSDK